MLRLDTLQRSEPSSPSRRSVLQVALAAAATVICLATALDTARADVTNSYVFSSGASTTLGGNTETISGSFTFDTTTATETNLSVVLSGATYTGTFTANSGDAAALNRVFGVDGANELFVYFTDPLNVSPDTLQGVELSVASTFDLYIDDGPSGNVVFASTAVPEPASLALLGTALIGFGAIRRRKNASRSSPAG